VRQTQERRWGAHARAGAVAASGEPELDSPGAAVSVPLHGAGSLSECLPLSNEDRVTSTAAVTTRLLK
jgi:hypothetical protein